MSDRVIFYHWSSFFLLCALTICSYLFFFQKNLFVPDKWDGVLAAWTIRRVQDNLLTGRSLFDGNTFSPHPNTIAFSDTFVTSAVLSLPLRFLTTDPVRHLQYHIVLSHLLSTIALYFLLWVVLKDVDSLYQRFVLSLTGAVIFCWSGVYLHYVVHLQMLTLQFLISGILFLVLFWRRQRPIYLYLCASMLVLQAWQSIFLVYAAMLFFASTLFLTAARHLYTRHARHLIIAGLVFLVLVSPVILTYLSFFRTYQSTRDIREVIHFSMIPEDVWGKFFSPVILAVFALALFLHRSGEQSLVQRSSAIAGGLFFSLAFGPALHIGAETVKFVLLGYTLHVPLPYTALYYLLPGFQAFRTPSRFFPIVLLFVLIWSLQKISRVKISPTRMTLVCAGGLLLACLFAPRHTLYAVPAQSSYPMYVRWLRERPEHTVLYLPMADWVEIGNDHTRMLYSLEAGKQLVNGQSGFYPPDYVQLLTMMRTFPSRDSLEAIKKSGAQLLIIDAQVPDLSAVGFSLLYQDSQVRIYEI